MLHRSSTFHVYVQCFASLLLHFFVLYLGTTTNEVTKPSLLPPLPTPPSPSNLPPPSTMAPRFYKKLKTKVKDPVTKMNRALKGRSSMYLPVSSRLYFLLTTITGDSIGADSTASPATQLEQDAKVRARLPSTIPATERMTLDE
jgi:hypothetical protein